MILAGLLFTLVLSAAEPSLNFMVMCTNMVESALIVVTFVICYLLIHGRTVSTTYILSLSSVVKDSKIIKAAPIKIIESATLKAGK